MQEVAAKNWIAHVHMAFKDPDAHPRVPLSFTRFTVMSNGGRLPVRLWQAAGDGPKGTVVITPPMGGSESMNSLIFPLTYAGMNVISFRPRGVRDPAFTYLMSQTIDDGHSIVAWIVANSGRGKTAPDGEPLRLDASRIAFFGMSGGGGNTSVAICAESKYCDYAIGASTGDMDTQLTTAWLDSMKAANDKVREATFGQTDFDRWLRALTPADRKRLTIRENAARLVDKHVMLLGGSYDTTSPVAIGHMPNAAALRNAGLKDFTDLIIEADHGFSTKRHTLARVLVAWLTSRGF